uniref:Uncharacterized protein n=1 Tax=Eutreptiella gymnastica TaxID=73025 RepID=A0A7S1HVW5_9EUGL
MLFGTPLKDLVRGLASEYDAVFEVCAQNCLQFGARGASTLPFCMVLPAQNHLSPCPHLSPPMPRNADRPCSTQNGQTRQAEPVAIDTAVPLTPLTEPLFG